MKSVLISIQPKWCDLIASGEKTVEVRKTAPKLQTPFKCYIYETKSRQIVHLDGCDVTYFGCGNVIGEFVCDKIIKYEGGVDYGVIDGREFYCGTLAECTGLTRAECIEYGKKKIPIGWELQTLYGWHISAIKIYDKPKELAEFRATCKLFKKRICSSRTLCGEQKGICDGTKEINVAPQSWLYVEG